MAKKSQKQLFEEQTSWIVDNIRKGLIAHDPYIYVFTIDDIRQIGRGDLIPLSREITESFLHIKCLGYKICPECGRKMNEAVVKEELRMGKIKQWMCECGYVDPRGWISE